MLLLLPPHRWSTLIKTVHTSKLSWRKTPQHSLLRISLPTPHEPHTIPLCPLVIYQILLLYDHRLHAIHTNFCRSDTFTILHTIEHNTPIFIQKKKRHAYLHLLQLNGSWPLPPPEAHPLSSPWSRQPTSRMTTILLLVMQKKQVMAWCYTTFSTILRNVP